MRARLMPALAAKPDMPDHITFLKKDALASQNSRANGESFDRSVDA